MMVYYFIIAILLAAIIWAHWYVRRRKQDPTSAINEALPRASVHPDMHKAMGELDEETELWLWKALSRGQGYRVWRSDAQFVDDQILHEFQILAPEEDPPGEGMLFSWT